MKACSRNDNQCSIRPQDTLHFNQESQVVDEIGGESGYYRIVLKKLRKGKERSCELDALLLKPKILLGEKLQAGVYYLSIVEDTLIL